MKRSSESGFSVLELLVIVLIIGIIAGVALLNAVSARQSYLVTIAANALEQQLNIARQEAVRANQSMLIKVEAQRTIIDINRNEAFTDAADTVGTISDLVSVTSFVPDTGIVRFNSRGELPVGVNPVFTVSYQGRSRDVTIDPRGAITVEAEEN